MPGQSAAEPERASAGATAELDAMPARDITASVAPSDPAAQVARCRRLIGTMHPDDQEEAVGLMEEVETALAANDAGALDSASKALNEFLFFVEGR